MTAPARARAAPPAARGRRLRAPSYEGLCWPKPDQRLLLECLHLPAQPARAAYRAWRDAVDLDTVDAGSLSLMPQLYFRLLALGVSDPILPRLKGAHRRTWCHGQLLARGAMAAVDALAARGIRPLALKGLPLLERCYGGDFGLRPMADVDLLVPRARAPEAFDALAGAGFATWPRLTPGELAAKRETFHGWTFRRQDVEVDLHWASLIEDLSAAGDARLWARAEPWTFAGRALLRPSPADLLLHVCVHGARWSRTMSVAWVADAMRMLAPPERAGRAPAVDWTSLLAEARARSLQIPLRETLRFLREALGAPVPGEVIAALLPPEPAWIFWHEHHAFSADPRKSTALHRAAARAAARLRAGQPVDGLAELG